ncbi:MAG: DNA/RNA nuclease SfsA [Lentisphaeraceae bacterium]|nr:DNA/RNA nuclease SfsA [Lentisphaeraceae bacterium]
MKFSTELVSGNLIKRYKRFLADVRLESGDEITAHCANSGRMTDCQGDDWPVLMTYHNNNPKRKLQYTWELVHNGSCWICVNTQRANEVAYEAVCAGQIDELTGYDLVERERKYAERSRIDLLLHRGDEKCYVEVKSVSLTNEGKYTFPDAPTERGRKHLEDLLLMKQQGHRAVMLFMLMRSDGSEFTPAAHIDPKYAEKLKAVHAAGVEVLVYGTKIDKSGISLTKSESFIL